MNCADLILSFCCDTLIFWMLIYKQVFLTTVLSTSHGKTFFAWRFILNENILFWLTISNQNPFVFSVSVLFSNIYIKIKLTAKYWSNLCNFYSKVIFWNFSEKIFFTFICWIWIFDVPQQYCENFRKKEQVELVENLGPNYLPYRFLYVLVSFLLWEKVKIFDFLKTND